MTLFILFIGLLIQPQQDADDLKKEVLRLKSEVRHLEKKLEIAERNGFYWTGVKAVGSPLSLVKSLPKELELKRNAFWGKHELEKVNEEFRQSNNLPFAAKVRVDRLTVQEGKSEGSFDVTLGIVPQTFSFKGHNFQFYFHHPSFPYRFTVDGETAKKLKSINTKRLIPLSGQIKNIELRRQSFTIPLKRMTLDSVDLPN